MHYRGKVRAGRIPVPNHTVVAVRRLKRREDTGDISVKRWSNFFVADKKGLGGVLLHNSKATLMQQDVRFARSAKRLRRSQIVGYRRVIDIHLTLLDSDEASGQHDPLDASNAYTVMMPPISYLDEWERLQLIELRTRIVADMGRLATDMQMDPRVWAIYVLLTYAKLPEDLVLKLIAKTPDTPMAMGGGGFEHIENMPDVMKEWMAKPENAKAVFGDVGTSGFTQVSAEEQLTIAKMMHRSPQLRKLVGDVAYYYEDEVNGEGDVKDDSVLNESVRIQQSRQIDASTLPPRSKGSTIRIQDCVDADADEKQLTEDMQALRIGKQLTEDDGGASTTTEKEG